MLHLNPCSSSAGENSSKPCSPQAAAVHLGIQVLVALFEAVPSAQDGLLREIQSKLVGVPEEMSLPFVAVLAELVQRHPRAVLEHAELLKVANFNHLPIHVAYCVNSM